MVPVSRAVMVPAMHGKGPSAAMWSGGQPSLLDAVLSGVLARPAIRDELGEPSTYGSILKISLAAVRVPGCMFDAYYESGI
jgi:hypothetical protein